MRHLYSSVAASIGHSLHIIRALLGHTQVATTNRHAHLIAECLRATGDSTASTIAAGLERRPKR